MVKQPVDIISAKGCMNDCPSRFDFACYSWIESFID